ncbi:hypothetical protein O1L60_41405 [Streptomyces diastatochromogenes]|nr:hypothetical protein [Streptomyces diastatochromogenes]
MFASPGVPPARRHVSSSHLRPSRPYPCPRRSAPERSSCPVAPAPPSPSPSPSPSIDTETDASTNTNTDADADANTHADTHAVRRRQTRHGD